jgi:hypothetical protein
MSRRRAKKKKQEIPTVSVTVPPASLPQTILQLPVSSFPALAFLLNSPILRHLRKIVCLGVGDLCRRHAARLQLSFILKLRSELAVGDVTYFDPICCSDCSGALDRMGVRTEAEDSEGKFDSDPQILFFMPHCPRFLYHNLLLKNWTIEGLSGLAVIGNSFLEYSEKFRTFVQQKRSCVEDIFDAGVVVEQPLDFGGNEAFSTLSLMLIDREKLANVGDGLLAKRWRFMHAQGDE